MLTTGKVKKKPLAEINVVPYIDVMLVLLVIFMVTAPLIMQGVKVDLPNAPSAPLDKKEDEPLIVSIKQDGTYYLEVGGNPEVAKPLSEIRTIVTQVINQNPGIQVLVYGDEKVSHGAFIRLMTEMQAAGATSLGVVTEPPE